MTVPPGADATVSATWVVRVRPPPVPVTVTVAGPSVAVADAVKVNTLLLPVVDAGWKAAVTPLGRPVALSVTLLVKLVRTMPMVLVPLAPRFTVRLAGLAWSVKPAATRGGGDLVRVVLSPAPFTALTTKK